MQVGAAHGLHAVHGAHIARMALHQGRRHEGFADQLLLAVHIAQDAFEQLGALGHINGESGLGAWPEGWALLQPLLADPADPAGRAASGSASLQPARA